MTYEQECQARRYMWNRLGCKTKQKRREYAASVDKLPHDFTPSPEDNLKAMNNYAYANTPTSTSTITQMCTPNPFDTIPPLAPFLECTYKKAKTMYNDYDDNEFETPIQTRTDEQKKRDYLSNRLEDISREKRADTRTAFQMDNPEPHTMLDMVQRIQAGKFTLDKKQERSYPGCLYAIDWRDPATPMDEAGFDAARNEFNALKTATLDTIRIADPADGLKAIQTLETWTPTTLRLN